MAADPAEEAAKRYWQTVDPHYCEDDDVDMGFAIADGAAREALAPYRQRHLPLVNSCSALHPLPSCSCGAYAWRDCPDARDCYTEEELNRG